jgi:hypothetical protein
VCLFSQSAPMSVHTLMANNCALLNFGAGSCYKENVSLSDVTNNFVNSRARNNSEFIDNAAVKRIFALFVGPCARMGRE